MPGKVDNGRQDFDASAVQGLKLSLCVITRNEERFIAQCLASARPFVDEVVVVDTGSEDATIAIAESFAANVYRHPWTGDFSVARNQAIDHAGGDWLLFLDADECLAERDARLLRPLAARAGALGFKLIQRTYLWNANFVCASPNPKDYAEGRDYSDCLDVDVIRFFRNDSRIRYQGRVHELVEPAFAAQQLPVETTRLVIHHFGKVVDPAKLQLKKSLYLELGRRKAEEDGTDAMAQFELGVQLFELERHSECIPYFERALRLNPAFDLALLYLAKAHQLSGQSENAQLYYQKCLKRAPDNDKVLFDYANFVRDQGHFKAAVRLYRKAIGINPKHALALFNMGIVQVRLGDVDSGLASIHRAIQMNPDNAVFYEHLGRLPLSGEALRNTAGQLRGFLERFPGVSRCHAVLAGVYFRLQEFAKAMEAARRSLEIAPEQTDSNFILANAQFAQGQLEDAAASYQRVLQMEPGHIDSHMNLAAIAEHQNDFLQAIREYRQVLELRPGHAQALKRYVPAQARCEVLPDTPEIVERACAENPDDLQCLLMAGAILERCGHADRAIALYRRSAAGQPRWSTIVNPKLQRLETLMTRQ